MDADFAPVAVVAATPDDLPSIVAIDRESFTQPWPPHLLAEELGGAGSLALVARAGDGPPLAYALIRLLPDEAELLRLATPPAHRRRGLARALVLGGLDRLRRLGTRRCHLEVRVENLAAIRLYESLGFRPAGARRGYYADGADAALYAIDL
jgi:[ribosomal protein S18]-alanine N-acetyltransferase